MKLLVNKTGQNALEYILILSSVLVVLIVLLSPAKSGFMRQRLDETMNQSIEALECMAASFCYNKQECHPCGDGCCQPGETRTCPSDC